MKAKPILLGGFALMVLLQWFVPVDMILGKEAVLKEGKVFKFKSRPVDPSDPIRGRYVNLGFEEGTIELPDSNTIEEFYYGKHAYALLREDSLGYAQFFDLVLEKPQEDPYLEVMVLAVYNGVKHSVRVELPFERFYMEEFKAIEADRLYAAALSIDTVVEAYAEVSILQGESALRDVKVNGRSLADLAEEHMLLNEQTSSSETEEVLGEEIIEE